MRISLAAVLLAVAVTTVSCGSDQSPTGPSGPGGPSGPAGMAGTWRATKAVFVSVAPPTRTVDVVAQGTVVTLVLGADSTYTFTLAEPGVAPVVTTGTWSESIDVLTLTQTGATYSTQFDKALSGDALVLAGGSVQFEFTDGVTEEAKLTMTLARQ